MPKRALTSLACVLLLATAPGAALADGGAGDNEYQDPLAAPAPKKTHTKAPVAKTPSAQVAPAAAAAPSSASTSAPPSASPSSGQLPRTGAPAGLIGLSGATMILAGVSLRRRTAQQ